MSTRINHLILRSSLALGVVACALVAPASAVACGDGEWEFQPAIDYRPGGLDKSQKELNEGDFYQASARILRMFPTLRTAAVGVDPLIDRAHRMLALAAARADGALPVHREVPRWVMGTWGGESAEAKEGNLRWAAQTMRRLNDKKKDDPALQSDMGEVLAKLDATKDEALGLLGKLAAKDLLVSPDAYAALAALRERAGDSPGREDALKKCEAMAKEPSVCGRARVAAMTSSKPQG